MISLSIESAYQVIDIREFIPGEQLYVVRSEELLFVSSVITNGPLGRFVLNICHESSHREVQFVSLSVAHIVLNCYSTVSVDWLCGSTSKRNTLMIFFQPQKSLFKSNEASLPQQPDARCPQAKLRGGGF